VTDRVRIAIAVERDVANPQARKPELIRAPGDRNLLRKIEIVFDSRLRGQDDAEGNLILTEDHV
jgi:hypothetical protein